MIYVLRKLSIVNLFFCWMLPMTVFAQSDGVRFVTGMSWRQVLAEAKKTNRFVFVDCYATWCAPCKRMDEKVYSDPAVGAFYNKYFVCVKLQMDTAKKDVDAIKARYADAHQLKMAFHVGTFPTFLYFSPEGKPVHEGLGYQDSSAILHLGEQAMDPGKQYFTLLGKFQVKTVDSAVELARLAVMAQGIKEDSVAHEVSMKYIDGLSKDDLLTPRNIEFLYRFTAHVSDRGFQWLKDSIELLSKINSNIRPESYGALVKKIIFDDEILPYVASDRGKPAWKRIEDNIRPYGAIGSESYKEHKPRIVFNMYIEPAVLADPDWKKILALIEDQKMGALQSGLAWETLNFYYKQLNNGQAGNGENFVRACTYFIKNYPSLAQSNQLNQFAWAVFQHDSSIQRDEIALGWAKHAIDSARDGDGWKPFYIDTYSNLLFKLGHRKDAISWEERALALMPKSKTFAETLKKMNDAAELRH